MATLASILLDSGAFLQNVDEPNEFLEVGYFQSGLDALGGLAPDIRVYKNGYYYKNKHLKLGGYQSTIDVQWLRNGVPITGISVADCFKENLLRKSDLYSSASPDYIRDNFDCIIKFSSGHFCCSNVMPRTFAETDVRTGLYTGKRKKVRKLIAHDAIVHFELVADDELKLTRSDGVELFSSNDLGTDVSHFEVQLIADNSTAERFFRDAMDHKGPTCWLPNQGHPPVQGGP